MRYFSCQFTKILFGPFLLVLFWHNLFAQCSQWNLAIPARCANSPSFLLTGGTPTPGVYFGPGVIGSTFFPSVAGPGSHIIRYKANACTDTASKTLIVNAVTTPTLTGLDTAYCINRSPQIIPLTGLPVGGTYNGPGVSGSNFNIGLAGVGNHTVRYIFTNASSCIDTANVAVRVRALPVVTFSLPTAQKFVCEFDGPFAISGASPNPGWPNSWFKGSGVDSLLGTFEPDPSILGWNVIKFYYNDGMCQSDATDSIEVRTNPTVTLTAFPIVCINDAPFQLTQGSGSPGGGTHTYTGPGITGGPISYFFSAAVAGIGQHTITYCYKGSNGCETCVAQNITVADIPAVFFGQILPASPGICENNGPIDLTTRGIPTGGYFTGAGIQSDSITLIPSQMGGPGTYSLTYTYIDTNGCSNSATRSVKLHPSPLISINGIAPLPTPNPPPNQSDVTIKICLDDSAATTITTNPTYTIPEQIFPANGTFTKVAATIYFYPIDDSDYEIVIFDDSGCVDTAFLHIDVIPFAEAIISGSSIICMGDTTTLVASGASTYTWLNPSATTPEVLVSPKNQTVYEVVANSDTDGDGKKCSSDTGEFSMDVSPLPLITTGRDTTVFYGDEIVLTALGGISYIWSESVNGELSCTECTGPLATPLYQKNGASFRWYSVLGTDSIGCENTDTIIVNLNPKIVIFIPTAFSPNSDGMNDELKVETKGIASIVFEVYDRFGHTVYESTNIDDSWDGKFEGEILPKDVYFYKLMAFPFEKVVQPVNQAGEITIIR